MNFNDFTDLVDKLNKNQNLIIPYGFKNNPFRSDFIITLACTGLGRNEYRAAFFENQIRVGLGTPSRSAYRFKTSSDEQGIAPLLDRSRCPIYVPPTPIPSSLNYLNIKLLF